MLHVGRICTNVTENLKTMNTINTYGMLCFKLKVNHVQENLTINSNGKFISMWFHGFWICTVT